MTIAFENKRIFMVGGPGGVGKTTLAAALGIRLAEKGFRTLVLTVDPARRLAQALGIEGFSNSVQDVALPGFEKGILRATMLDSEHYFDKVIERFATSPEQRDKILNSRVYRTMVESLGGSHEYAAMERLLEFANLQEYEKIVVDTPPTQNALDLLDAPQRLADFMDSSILKWFQKKGGLHLFQRGTQFAMKILQKVLGGEFLESLSEVLSDLEGMQSGFRNRNLEVVRLLQSTTTSFILVTGASEDRFLESVQFQKGLSERQIPLSAVVLNRVEPEPKASDLKSLPSDQRRWIEALEDYYRKLHASQAKWVTAFQKSMNIPTLSIPRRVTAVNDIAGLSELGQSLVK